MLVVERFFSKWKLCIKNKRGIFIKVLGQVLFSRFDADDDCGNVMIRWQFCCCLHPESLL
jgi:hypothetical protein